MTDNIRYFLEENVDLIEEDTQLFLTHAYEQLTDLETKELVQILQVANINIATEIEQFIRSFISYNIKNYDEELVDDFVDDIPPFGKTKYEIHGLVCDMADSLGFDVVTDNQWDDYLEARK